MKLWQKWKQTTVANQLMVVTTAIVAFGTIFYALVAVFQWQLMKESALQTSIQNDKLIAEARSIADTSSETAKQSRKALDAAIEAATKQNKAMNNQIRIMQQQLEITDRPLLKVTIAVTSPLRFSEGNKQVNCDISIAMKNIGRSVASNVNWAARLYLANWMKGNAILDPVREQKKLCDNLLMKESNEIIEGESILPGDDRINSTTVSASIAGHDFNPTEIPDASFIVPVVIGCANYHFPYSSKSHQTAFIYRIVQIHPTTNKPRAIRVGKDIPLENIRLDTEVWGGRFTD